MRFRDGEKKKNVTEKFSIQYLALKPYFDLNKIMDMKLI